MTQNDKPDTEEIAHVRDLKRTLVSVHKELLNIKRIPYRESKFTRGIREIKLADTNLQQAIAWLDSSIWELKKDEAAFEQEGGE